MNDLYIYRYRSTESVLGKYKELERQEIYFAESTELNDPMEGSIVPFYKGYNTHWVFFMRHSFQYVLMKCLMNNYKGRYVSKSLVDNWQDDLMKDSSITKIILDLEETEDHYRNNQIRYMLQYILIPFFYWTAISCLNTVFLVSDNRARMNEDMKQRAKRLLDDVASIGMDIFLRPENTNCSSDICSLKNRIETAWNVFYFEEHLKNDNITSNLFLLPTEILQHLDNMLRPKFRIASFSKCCNSASMWGLYANAQDGVCLKFQTSRREKGVTLELEDNIAEDVYIHDVVYTGNLMNLETAYNLLAIIDARVKGNANSPEFYKGYEAPYLQKIEDWRFEQEVRMIIPDYGKDFSKLKYKSSSLCAIMWGGRVSFKDRCEMVDIMRSKYEDKDESKFEFYEYDPSNQDWDKKPVYVINE